MSFRFKWDDFDPAFRGRAAKLLTQALNQGPKPAIITADIDVKELDMGKIAPELELVEIGDVSKERFRGVLKLTYNGDASVVLQTEVQVNPLNTYLETTPEFTAPDMLCAAAPLTIPLFVRLSDIRLSGIIILAFSRQKGCTVFFRNDPLESIRVSSTFNGIPAIARYLQREIEGQLRYLFREELPAIIHKLSLSWFNTPPPQEPSAPAEPRQYPDFEYIGSCDELLALMSKNMTLSPDTSPIDGVIYRPGSDRESRSSGQGRPASSSLSSNSSSYTELQRLALRGFGEVKRKRRRRVIHLSSVQSEPEVEPTTTKDQDEKAYIVAQMVDALAAQRKQKLGKLGGTL